MSDPGRAPARESHREHEDEDSAPGPSLTLIYSLIALALLAAIFLAGMIVLPFYRGR